MHDLYLSRDAQGFKVGTCWEWATLPLPPQGPNGQNGYTSLSFLRVPGANHREKTGMCRNLGDIGS